MKNKIRNKNKKKLEIKIIEINKYEIVEIYVEKIIKIIKMKVDDMIMIIFKFHSKLNVK